MAIDRRFPLGARAAGSDYHIEEHLRGEPARGMYRALDPNGQAALVTLGTRQTRPFGDLRAELALPFAGITRLIDLGRVEGGRGEYDAIVEAEPPGDPVSGLGVQLGPGAAIELAQRLLELLAPLHGEGRALAFLRPELIYVESGLTLELAVSGIAPRGERFLESAAPPSYGVPPMYQQLYLAPEVIAGGERKPACDVFSIAAMTAQWATGQHPFGHGAPVQTMGAIAAGRRAPWTGPGHLGAALDRALAVAPARRPAPADLAAELRGALPN